MHKKKHEIPSAWKGIMKKKTPDPERIDPSSSSRVPRLRFQVRTGDYDQDDDQDGDDDDDDYDGDRRFIITRLSP